MSAVACGSCRFWDAVRAESRGRCRIASPKAVVPSLGTEVEVIAVWPETAFTDWCGQFRPDQVPPNAC